MFVHGMSNAKNPYWICRHECSLYDSANEEDFFFFFGMQVLVMQVSFMRMQMRMYVLVMYGFAPAWICRCKCNQMMVQMKIFYFANVFQEDAYANIMHVMQMFEPILMDVQKFIDRKSVV